MGDGMVSKKQILIMAGGTSEWGVQVSAELSRLGYDTAMVPDADSAWQALASREYDAVILEVLDDVAEGCLITRMLRDRWGVPIVVLSTSTSAQDRVKCYQAGADIYLVEPLDLPEFVARLGGLLRRITINAKLRQRFGQSKLNYDRAWVSRQ